jgi:hypothetical protein
MITVVVDLSVVVHQIHNSIEAAGGLPPDARKGAVSANLAWMLSGHWLGSLVKPGDFQIICVGDAKPYWRSEYLLRPSVYGSVVTRKLSRHKVPRITEKPHGPIHYKAGRKLPKRTLTKAKEQTYETLQAKGARVLRLTGYEADDLAAAVTVISRDFPDNRIILATVDSDWMGLVSPWVSWFCLYGYFPRLRDTMEPINQWCLRRIKTTIETPRDLWKIKASQGDKSDNLPPGSPLEVIDLLSPPEGHRLWENTQVSGVIRHWLSEPQEPLVTDPDEALDYLRACGLQPAIRPFDPDSDLYYPEVA